MEYKTSPRHLRVISADAAPAKLPHGEDLFSIGAHLTFCWVNACLSAFALACRPWPARMPDPGSSEQALRAVVIKLHADNTRARKPG